MPRIHVKGGAQQEVSCCLEPVYTRRILQGYYGEETGAAGSCSGLLGRRTSRRIAQSRRRRRRIPLLLLLQLLPLLLLWRILQKRRRRRRRPLRILGRMRRKRGSKQQLCFAKTFQMWRQKAYSMQTKERKTHHGPLPFASRALLTHSLSAERWPSTAI